MGMFDWINFEMDCPKCGKRVKDFQSKDSDCMFNLVAPDEVDNFYASCPGCLTWIEFCRHHKPREPLPNRAPYTFDEVTAIGFDLKTSQGASR